MKALNQYTFAGAVSAVFLAIASYYVKFASMSVLALSFATVGVFSTALVFFMAVQLTYAYFFPEAASTKITSVEANKPNKLNNPDTPVIPDKLSEQAQAVIGINMNKICQTSGWYNNCGLNCMTHFMFKKLSAIPKNQFARFLRENPEYDSFLSTFQSYYGLNQKPNWSFILQVLSDHTRSDQEAIFAPVLRLHMGKVLPKFTEELWDTKFATAISEYINNTNNTVTDVAQAVYQSNKLFFIEHKKEYRKAVEKALAVQITEEERKIAAKAIQDNIDYQKKKNEGKITLINQSVTDETIKEQVSFARKRKVEDKMLLKAKTYWNKQGCKAYADYIADLENSEMISADQLQWLGQQFNIGVEVYTPASMERAISNPELAKTNKGMQSKPEGTFKWTMRVHNSGVHWTFEESNQSQDAADQHNANFSSDGAKSSQFKRLGVDKIKKAIQELVNAPKMLLHKHSSSPKKTSAPAVVVAKASARKRKAPAR